ncbi:MAG: DUF465 domain-containing protein [Acidobacteriota bacterium]
MSTSSADLLKVELMTSNPEFRELVKEHQRYEIRLSELASLPYPSEQERMEQAILKKKKLYVKDKMELILQNFKRNAIGH